MIEDIKKWNKIEALNKCKIFMDKEDLFERIININSPKIQKDE